VNTIVILASVALSAVFAVSGVTKLFDRAGAEDGMRDFGLPGILARPMALLLPLTELVLAIGMLTGLAWAAAIGLVALLAIFTAAILVNLALGRRPACHCFGALSQEPIGPVTVVRNGVLIAVALLVAIQGPDGASVGGWLTDLETAEAVGVVGLAIASLMLSGVYSMLVRVFLANGRALVRLDAIEAGLDGRTDLEPVGLPVGTPAPAFVLPSLEGPQASLDGLLAAGKPLVMLFVAPDCRPCRRLVPEVVKWQRQLGVRATFAVLSTGDGRFDGLENATDVLMLLREDAVPSEAYGVIGTPSAVVVGADGRIAAELAEGAGQIHALVDAVRTGRFSPAAVTTAR
jgi:uncharacterized membrane protein YphA (DoxX/SURF4 family)